MTTDEYHAKVRRIFAGAFSDRALKLQQSLVCRHVDRTVHNIHGTIVGEPLPNIDIVQMYNFLASDVMSDLAFAKANSMLDNSEPSPWLNIIYGYVKATNLLVAIRFNHVFGPFVGLVLLKQDRNARDQHFKNSASLLDERLRRGRDKLDI